MQLRCARHPDQATILGFLVCLFHCNTDGYGDIVEIPTQKEITSQTDLNLVILSSKTYVFEEKMTKYKSS